jgi:hypothetical protein
MASNSPDDLGFLHCGQWQRVKYERHYLATLGRAPQLRNARLALGGTQARKAVGRDGRGIEGMSRRLLSGG